MTAVADFAFKAGRLFHYAFSLRERPGSQNPEYAQLADLMRDTGFRPATPIEVGLRHSPIGITITIVRCSTFALTSGAARGRSCWSA
jgi:hypothetical protein